MKKISNVLLIVIMTSISVYSRYRDTGFIKWKQPNGIEFTARYWGDEYFDWMETQDGYRIIQATDMYYYYAILNEYGEFAPGKNRIGIDKALQESKNLERSKDRIDKLMSWRESSQKNYEDYFNSITSSIESIKSGTSIKKLGVILVDFPSESAWGYEKANFDEVFFSANTWIGDEKHPEGHLLFGSVYDYYLDQLNVEIEGKNGQQLIVNNPNTNPDYPLWMTMDYDKSHYAYMGRITTFNLTLIAEAKSEFGSTLIESFDVLVFVFVGANMGNWKSHGDPANWFHD